MSRVTIRRSVYRDREGFTVGSGRGIFGTHIFCRTRLGAEAIKAALQLDDDRREAREKIIDGILMGGL